MGPVQFLIHMMFKYQFIRFANNIISHTTWYSSRNRGFNKDLHTLFDV